MQNIRRRYYSPKETRCYSKREKRGSHIPLPKGENKYVPTKSWEITKGDDYKCRTISREVI